MRSDRVVGLLVGAVVALVIGSTLVVAGAGPSEAKPGDPVLGELEISPATGDFNTLIDYITPSACPTEAVRAYTRLIGPGFSAANGFADGYTALFDTYTSPPGPVPVTSGPFRKSMQNTLGYITQSVATLEGDYEIRVTCARAALGPQTPALGDFVAKVHLSTASSSYQWVRETPPTTTTTSTTTTSTTSTTSTTTTSTTSTTTTSTTTTTIPTSAGSISGRVTGTGGAGVGGAVVRLYDSAASLRAAVRTDGTGAFSFGDLDPGRYRVYVVEDDLHYGRWSGDAASFGAATPIDVAGAAATADISLEARASRGAVGGTLAVAEGTVVRLYDADAALRSAVKVGADGTYRLADLQPGTYKVYVLAAPASPYYSQWWDGAPSFGTSGAVVVSAGQTTAVSPALVAKASKGRVAGTVTSPGGPAVGTIVRLYDDGGALQAAGRVGADGGFALGDLEPGSYRAFVVDPSGSTYRNQWFDHTASWGASTPVVVLAGTTTTIDPVLELIG